jgi:hypothetical protein
MLFSAMGLCQIPLYIVAPQKPQNPENMVFYG